MLTKPTELAYLAGVIDSDGSISINRKKQPSGNLSYWVCIQLAQKDPTTVYWLGEEENRSVYDTIPNSPLAHPDTIMHKIMWQGASGHVLLQRLLPYLRIKLPQALTALEFFETAVTAEDKERLCDAIRGLNGRRFKGEPL